jgi:hypothetical protein
MFLTPFISSDTPKVHHTFNLQQRLRRLYVRAKWQTAKDFSLHLSLTFNVMRNDTRQLYRSLYYLKFTCNYKFKI